MQSISTTSATSAPPTILFQANHVRRRISASDSVAALVASLAFGDCRRSDLSTLAAVTASRITSASTGAL